LQDARRAAYDFSPLRGMTIFEESPMKRLSLALLGAVGAFCVLTPAQASDYRVIQYNDTRICQIYDMTWQIKPFSGYKVLTKSLPTFAAATDAKAQVAKKANCLI
jgi:hypothetical protein